MAEFVLNLETRKQTGTGAVKKIRRTGRIPGVFYFHGQKSITFNVQKSELATIHGHESALIEAIIDGKDRRKCIIREIQFDPLTQSPIHIDLLGIKLTEKITVSVPLVYLGTPAGVKTEGGLMQQLYREIEIECLPTDIPEKIEIDVTHLSIGNSIRIGDIHVDNVKILSDPEIALVNVVALRAAEEVAPSPEVETAEPEVITKRAEEEKE